MKDLPAFEVITSTDTFDEKEIKSKLVSFSWNGSPSRIGHPVRDLICFPRRHINSPQVAIYHQMFRVL